MNHPHLTNSETALIETFNASNGDGMRMSYAPRQKVFTLTDRTGRLIASHVDSWELENVALMHIAADVELMMAA